MHSELRLARGATPELIGLDKEQLTAMVIQKAKKWGIEPTLHIGPTFLKNLATDLCSLYGKAYTASLSRCRFVAELKQPYHPLKLRVDDPRQAKMCIEKHFAMIVELYALLMEKAPYLAHSLSITLLEATWSMQAMYFRDLDPFFASVAYEEYTPGVPYFNYDISLADFNIRGALNDLSKISLVGYQHQPGPIVIAYRDSDWGRGPLFDHKTIQRITQRPTLMSAPQHTSMDAFKKAINESSMVATFNASEIHQGKFFCPGIATEEEEKSGLLIITGRGPVGSRIEMQRLRNEHERPRIRNAFGSRQPLLAICGGMWQTIGALLHASPDINDGPEMGLHDTPSHTGPMPRLSDYGTVQNNVLSHKTRINPNSILPALMETADTEHISCNSVHWQAVRPDAFQRDFVRGFAKIAHIVKVAALSSTPFKNNTKAPEPNVIEAFTAHDAPQVAVQWHPEAFANDTSESAKPHHALVRNMAREADIFAQRYQMLKEIRMIAQKGGAIYQINPLAAQAIDEALQLELE